MNSRILTLLCSLCIVSQMDARINDRCELTQETAMTTITTMSITNDCMVNATSGATANTTEDITKLSHRVDSLEHELMYLKLTFKWEKLRLNLSNEKNSFDIYSNALQINILAHNFDYDLYQMYRRYYSSCVDNLSSSERLFNAMEIGLNLDMQANNFSEMERMTLESLYEVVKNELDSSKAALNFYKTALDAYGKHI